MPRLLPATEHRAWAGAHAPGALLPRASWTHEFGGHAERGSAGATAAGAECQWATFAAQRPRACASMARWGVGLARALVRFTANAER